MHAPTWAAANHLIELAEERDLRAREAASMRLTLSRRRPLSAGPAHAEHVRNNRKLEAMKEGACSRAAKSEAGCGHSRVVVYVRCSRALRSPSLSPPAPPFPRAPAAQSAQIEHDNLLLLSRMHTIIRAGPSADHWRDPRTANKGSMNVRVRRAEIERIERENQVRGGGAAVLR